MANNPSATVLFVFTLCALTTCGRAVSHDGATGVVKQRMDSMEVLKDHSKKIAGMFKGESEFDRDTVAAAAAAFVEQGTHMAHMFPNTKESRSGSVTQARQAIWDDWEAFSEMAEEFLQQSQSLESLANTAPESELEILFKDASQTCSQCHKRFRKKEK